MATTTVQTLDLAQVIADALADVEGLRTYAYVADTVRPPSNGAALVIMQPSVDYLDVTAGFCAATWSFPLTLVVTRANERDSQLALSTYLQLITSALTDANAPGVFSIEPVDASPITAQLSGADMPGYSINVRVRA